MKYITEEKWRLLVSVFDGSEGLVDFLLKFLGLARRQPEICAADDCDKSFVPCNKNHARHIYCSDTCRNRVAKRRERAREKVETR